MKLIAPPSMSFPQKTNTPHSRELSVGQKLETVFLSEMLKAAGFGEVSDSFGGGVGEGQFASFLRDAQAQEMVRAGGVGLAPYFDTTIKGVEQ